MFRHFVCNFPYTFIVDMLNFIDGWKLSGWGWKVLFSDNGDTRIICHNWGKQGKIMEKGGLCGTNEFKVYIER